MNSEQLDGLALADWCLAHPALAADDIEQMRELVSRIGRFARSDGSRTFDDTIRDLGLIDAICRAALKGPQA